MDKLPDVHDPAFRRARGLPDEAIKTTPIGVADPVWAERLRTFWWHHENVKSAEPEIIALHKLLLSIGGEETCLAKQDPDTGKGQDKIYTLTVKPQSLLPLAARSGARPRKMLRTAPKWAVRNFFAKIFWEQNRRFPFSASPDYIYYICSRVPKLKCEIFATFLIEIYL